MPCHPTSDTRYLFLHVKPKQNHIPVFDDVILAFAAHPSGGPRRLFTSRRLKILERHRFGPNKPSLEVRVNEGGAIATGFQQASFLSDLVPQMITTGEETGNLALVMGRVADFYEREWRKRIAVFSKLAEPAMLLVMGAVVGLIVSSLILPIFQLSKVVH